MKSWLLLLALCLSACVATGPADSPQLGEILSRSLPPESGAVLVAKTGTWTPNSRGYTNVRSLAGRQPNPGLVTITENSLLFSQWSEGTQKYDVMKRIFLADIRDVTTDSFGGSKALVVQNTDYTYDTFEFTKAKGQLIDPVMADEARTLIKDKLSLPASTN